MALTPDGRAINGAIGREVAVGGRLDRTMA